jgi:hypothetical protein
MVYNIEGSAVHESAVEMDSLIVSTAKELDPTLDVAVSTFRILNLINNFI